MGPATHEITSLSFHVNQFPPPPTTPTPQPLHPHTWDTIHSFAKIWPWKSKVNLWVRLKFKVTKWVWFYIDSHPFGSTSICLPIPAIRFLFQNLTLKPQVKVIAQVHITGPGSNIVSTHIGFAPCQSSLTLLRFGNFQIWSWKSKVKVMGEVKG